MIPSIEINNADIGTLLGSGGFCSVYDITVDFHDSNNDVWASQSSLFYEDHSTTSNSTDSSLHSSSQVSFTSSQSSLCTTKTTNSTRFALKKLKKEVLTCSEQREAATKDLQKEASILSELPEHPHIIRLQAVSIDFWTKVTARSAESAEPYMVLEKLQGTLDRRLKRWSKQLVSPLPRSKTTLISLESDRLVEAGAQGIAKALEFLHANKVIFRDLKPGNIGFALDGTVRLFDFGLARKMPEGDKDYCMTFAGTARYMAPEIVNDTGYNQSVDVYSLGMVLWEICALEKPFAKARSIDQLLGWVGKGKNRPCMRKVASPQLRQLLASCIHPNSNERPSTREVVEKLEDERGN